MNPETFYMVWGENTKAPAVKHATYATARQEAGRLACAHPGQRFVVLEAVESCINAAVTWDRYLRKAWPVPQWGAADGVK